MFKKIRLKLIIMLVAVGIFPTKGNLKLLLRKVKKIKFFKMNQ
jgi:hypothetical protein